MSNRSHSPPPRRSPSPPRERDDYAVNPGNNLFVTGVALDCTDEELNDLFGKFGKISRSNIMRDPHTRDSRGFAFVSFEDLKCADNARESLNQTEFMGKMLVIDRAKRGAARVPTPGHYYGPIRRGCIYF